MTLVRLEPPPRACNMAPKHTWTGLHHLHGVSQHVRICWHLATIHQAAYGAGSVVVPAVVVHAASTYVCQVHDTKHRALHPLDWCLLLSAASLVTTATAAAATAAVSAAADSCVCSWHACSPCIRRRGRPQFAAQGERRLRAYLFCIAYIACLAQPHGTEPACAPC